jgi:hypothetical protein
MRSVWMSWVIVAALAAAGAAQSRSQGFGRSAGDWCGDTWSDRPQHCEVREATIGGANPIDVDAGGNGGIRVRGSDRGDVLVRSKIVASGNSEAEARQIVSGVRIQTDGGRVRAEGPTTDRDRHWSVSFELSVPRAAQLTLTTRNGGISIEDFSGRAEFTAQNGGVTLRDVGGDIHGGTTNGGVTVDLSSAFWNGTGLDVHTTNGGVRMTLPDNFSGELEAGTVNGRINIDFPITVQGSIGRHIQTTLGSGGPKVKAVTTNGGVTIRRR